MKKLTIKDKKGSIPQFFKGRTRLIETYSYIFEIEDNGEKLEGELIIDGVLDDNGNQRKIKLNKLSDIPFINCLGIFTLSYENEKIAEIDIITVKLDSFNANSIFEYVYSFSSSLIEKYLNKQRFFNSNNSNSNNSSILNYIAIIKESLSCLKRNYIKIKIRPVYKLKSSTTIEQYDNMKVNDKSIQWLLQNLDDLHIGYSLKNVPESFEINSTYAISPNILIEDSKNDHDVYENSIIKGFIIILGNKIKYLSELISSILLEDIESDSNYASFVSLKRIILKNELENLSQLKKEYSVIQRMYKNIFVNVNPIFENPRFTHNFKKERHYNEVYKRIQLFNNSDLNASGLHIVLGIKNLDKLYELYNLYRCIDFFEEYTGKDASEININEFDILFVKFKYKSSTYTIYNQLKIYSYDKTPQFEGMKLFQNSSINNYYTPDIVIERSINNDKSYAILDSKFSTKKWICGSNKNLGETTQKIIGKYYFSISHRDSAYKKSDLLLLLYPEKGKINYFTKEENFFPIIGAVPSIPGNDSELKKILGTFIKDYNNN